MKITIIGIRGIPVTYSAFETFAEVLAIELVKLNHKVSVYNRNKYVSANRKRYKGVTLINLPSIEKTNFSTLSHSLLSTLHACVINRPDLILYLGVGNTIYSVLPRFLGIKTVVHIDGLDWKREKWGFVARKYLKISERLAAQLPSQTITDSVYMLRYYKKSYHKDIEYIPYGYFPQPPAKNVVPLLKKYKLTKNEYFVWAGRLVPENFVDEFILAFKNLKNKSIKALIIGDDLYESEYKKNVFKLIKSDSRIVSTGFIKHEDVLLLTESSLAYIETKRSGGTHMTLVEAMGAGTLVVSNLNKTNKDVLANSALFYPQKNSVNNLNRLLKDISLTPEKFNHLRKEVKERAEKYYRWDMVVNLYEKLFRDLTQF